MSANDAVNPDDGEGIDQFGAASGHASPRVGLEGVEDPAAKLDRALGAARSIAGAAAAAGVTAAPSPR